MRLNHVCEVSTLCALRLQVGSASSVPVSNSSGSGVDPIFAQIAASPDDQAASGGGPPAAALTAAVGAAALLLAALA